MTMSLIEDTISDFSTLFLAFAYASSCVWHKTSSRLFPTQFLTSLPRPINTEYGDMPPFSCASEDCACNCSCICNGNGISNACLTALDSPDKLGNAEATWWRLCEEWRTVPSECSSFSLSPPGFCLIFRCPAAVADASCIWLGLHDGQEFMLSTCDGCRCRVDGWCCEQTQGSQKGKCEANRMEFGLGPSIEARHRVLPIISAHRVDGRGGWGVPRKLHEFSNLQCCVVREKFLSDLSQSKTKWRRPNCWIPLQQQVCPTRKSTWKCWGKTKCRVNTKLHRQWMKNCTLQGYKALDLLQFCGETI